MTKPLHRLQDYFEESLEEKQAGLITDLECPVCRKPVRMEDIEAIAKNQEGYKSAEGKNVCVDCREVLTRAANVFCLRCNQLVLKAQPCTLGNGFRIKPQGMYHYKYCFRCTQVNPQYTVEEEHYRETGRYKDFTTGMEGRVR